METSLLDHLDISSEATDLLENSDEIKLGNCHKVSENNFPSLSDIVNEMSAETGISVKKNKEHEFDSEWHKSLENIFRRSGFEEELEEYKSLGSSNGYPLRLQLMILPPKKCFKIHAHPNIEFECTLLGALCEFRWLFKQSADEIHASNKDNIKGPTIPENSPFEYRKIRQGQCMLNEKGSVHQSFSEDDGCVILVLWSGCHANTHPSCVFNKDKRILPSAGW